jgi:hypothetical protein
MTTHGGCLCGQLRYSFEGKPKFIGKCYCGDCHKESGSGHITFLTVPGSAIGTTGERREFSKLGGSGQETTRTFCPDCGTTIFSHPTMLGDMRVVRAGTLDDPAGVVATFAIYCSRAADWDRPPAGLRLFAEVAKRR